MTPTLKELIPECFDPQKEGAFLYNLYEDIWTSLEPEDLPRVALDNVLYPDIVRKAASKPLE